MGLMADAEQILRKVAADERLEAVRQAEIRAWASVANYSKETPERIEAEAWCKTLCDAADLAGASAEKVGWSI